MPDDDRRPAPADDQRPRVLVSTGAIDPDVGTAGVTGAVWRLTGEDRGLDANVVQLPPGAAIDAHEGPDLDVLWHVVAGDGVLLTREGEGPRLAPGDVVHLPRGTVRGVRAGDGGIRYLTVHTRKPGLGLGATRA